MRIKFILDKPTVSLLGTKQKQNLQISQIWYFVLLEKPGIATFLPGWKPFFDHFNFIFQSLTCVPLFRASFRKIFSKPSGYSFAISRLRNVLEIRFLHENDQFDELSKVLLHSRIQKMHFSTTSCSNQPSESNQMRDASQPKVPLEGLTRYFAAISGTPWLGQFVP